MRRRLLPLLLLLALLLSLIPAAQAEGPNGSLAIERFHWRDKTYTASTAQRVNLTLNGSVLEGDVPAMIVDGRTMVPVRLVGEALAAQVLWVQQTGQVILRRGTDILVLTLDSGTALINGVSNLLPDGVPAQVVRFDGADRTMVPLRFVSEALGAQVTWVQESYTVHLTAELPQEPEVPAVPDDMEAAVLVTGIQVDDNAQTILVRTDQEAEYRILDLGDRVAVDVLEAGLSPDFLGNTAVDNELISAIRYAEHGDDLYPDCSRAVRVVLDLREGVSLQENVTVARTEGGILITTFQGDREEVPFVPTTPIDPHKSTVVLDPGHGGARLGAFYEGVAEKDIDLAVALKVERLLLNYGYNVVMTRREDVEIGLYERADMANAVEADLFVSIHANAAENRPDYQGIYTYYHPSSRRGARLAQAIQSPLCRLTGGIDRGIRDADFVVLRETEMCAVLVEMGFMSNHEELMRLLNDDYQELLALGIAEGIVSYLNDQME